MLTSNASGRYDDTYNNCVYKSFLAQGTECELVYCWASDLLLQRETVSGNSFKDLVPFAREPYRQERKGLLVNFERLLMVRHETSMSLFSFCRESDYERGTLNDFMREEKQRKQMEAIADDLFNNAKVPSYAKFILPELVMSCACLNLALTMEFQSKKRAAAGSSIHTLLTGCR